MERHIKAGNLPTAEEFLAASEAYFNQQNTPQNLSAELLKQFAKLHVKACKKSIHKTLQFPEEDLEFITNSYPETNIQ